MTSGSKNGIDQPPCWKPPSRSSSAPPGACTTPSRLMNSLITIRMPCRRWHSAELIDTNSAFLVRAPPGTGPTGHKTENNTTDGLPSRPGEPVRVLLGDSAGGAGVERPPVLSFNVLLAEVGADRLLARHGFLLQPEPLLGHHFGAGDGVLLVQHDLVLLFGDGRPVGRGVDVLAGDRLPHDAHLLV